MSKWAYISLTDRGKIIQATCLKKNQFDQVQGTKNEFEGFGPYNELVFKTKNLYSWFSPILLNQLIYFMK